MCSTLYHLLFRHCSTDLLSIGETRCFLVCLKVTLRVPWTFKPLLTSKCAWLMLYEPDCLSRLAVHDCLVELAYKEAGTSHAICHSDGSADKVRL